MLSKFPKNAPQSGRFLFCLCYRTSKNIMSFPKDIGTMCERFARSNPLFSSKITCKKRHEIASSL